MHMNLQCLNARINTTALMTYINTEVNCDIFKDIVIIKALFIQDNLLRLRVFFAIETCANR